MGSGSYRRVAVVGAVGCGKTTLAQDLARRIGAPHVELDALRYRPDWRRVPAEVFWERVYGHAGTDRWVIDGNDDSVQDITWLRAQTLVWIDFPVRVALWRLLRRTLVRLVRGETFANENREQLGRLLGGKSILMWTVRSHGPRRRHYERLIARPRYSHLEVARLRSASALRSWLERIPEPVPSHVLEA